MALFSQRRGLKPVRNTVQFENMDESLKNGIWNCFLVTVIQRYGFLDPNNYSAGEIHDFADLFWAEFLKRPIDDRPHGDDKIYNEIRRLFFQQFRWYEVYDFIEFVIRHTRETSKFEHAINRVLEKEMAAYRLVRSNIVEITSHAELNSIDTALSQEEFPGATGHLKRDLELVSDKQQPDPRNSIKESISAVESAAKAIAQTPKATLEDAIRVLEKNGSLHPSLKAGLSKLYGYTSDEGGIRHAMLDESNLTKADALFFLVTCSAFINYLKSKIK